VIAASDPGLISFRIVGYASGADGLSSWGYPPAVLPRAVVSFDAVTFVAAGHSIRRAICDAACGYDDALFFCWEAFDLSLRAIATGWGLLWRPCRSPRGQRVRWSGNRGSISSVTVSTSGANGQRAG